jgi:4,5-DOPA dioxygenase extradiol
VNLLLSIARGLDHGAYVPLMKMYPAADVPVIQMSIPTFDPEKLFKLGQKSASLRDEGVMIIWKRIHDPMDSHSFEISPSMRRLLVRSQEFDIWAKEVLDRGAVDELMNYKSLAPGMPYAHPTVEHFAPIFITLGAATVADVAPDTTIEGYWMGLSKRSFQVA